jgi:L-ribulose-5-phosphate 4-epimerase
MRRYRVPSVINISDYRWKGSLAVWPNLPVYQRIRNVSVNISTAVIREMRHALAELHAALVANGLVAWTSGNISARVPGEDLLVIKPSGVSYADLTPESMVVCDLAGARVWGDLAPSSDTASHAYIYRHMPQVGGVVHTHSRYATAWAARGEPIPCVLTAMADEFGGEIPVGPFAPIGGDEIGRAVVDTLTGHRSPAVLLRSHGVFTIGGTPKDAVKAAVMCEDAAATVHLAASLGELTPLPRDQIDALYARYQNEYGQRPLAGATRLRSVIAEDTEPQPLPSENP